jgi:hypothetical protein
MSKPATIAMVAAGVGVVALLFLLLLNNDRRAVPARPRGPVPVAAPTALEPGPSLAETAAATPQPTEGSTVVAPSTVTASALPPSALPAPVERDEQSLLTDLRDLAASDPPRSLKTAREAVERFPDSPNAPEFEWNVVKALFNMRQLEDAEDEARIMVARFPDNPFTGDVVHHLLNHPPNPADVPP